MQEYSLRKFFNLPFGNVMTTLLCFLFINFKHTFHCVTRYELQRVMERFSMCTKLIRMFEITVNEERTKVKLNIRINRSSDFNTGVKECLTAVWNCLMRCKYFLLNKIDQKQTTIAVQSNWIGQCYVNCGKKFEYFHRNTWRYECRSSESWELNYDKIYIKAKSQFWGQKKFCIIWKLEVASSTWRALIAMVANDCEHSISHDMTSGRPQVWIKAWIHILSLIHI